MFLVFEFSHKFTPFNPYNNLGMQAPQYSLDAVIGVTGTIQLPIDCVAYNMFLQKLIHFFYTPSFLELVYDIGPID